MKKYLGSKISAFCAIALLFLIFLPLVLSFLILCVKVEFATVMLCLFGILCSVIQTVYLKRVRKRLYSWGIFNEFGVVIKTLGNHKKFVGYNQYKDIGIGYYFHHGISSSSAGIKVSFIYFSREKLNNDYKGNIVRWNIGDDDCMVGFNQKFFDYLLKVLPAQKARKLETDYENNFS